MESRIGKPKKGECFHCGQVGHFKHDSWTLKKGKEAKAKDYSKAQARSVKGTVKT